MFRPPNPPGLLVNSAPGKLLGFPTPTSNIPGLLDALLADTARIDFVEDAHTTSALVVEIASRQMKLAAIQSALVSAQRPTVVPTSDRNLTVEEAAQRLGVSEQWLYRHSKTLPFAKKLSHRQLRFSERGMARWQTMRTAS